MSDDLKLIAGARVSDYIYNYSDRDVFQGANDLYESNTRDRGVFTPYYGLVYDLSRNFSFYGSAAKVFQPVNVKDELGRILDPKEGITYEIGSKSEFSDGRLNVGLSYYWKRWENTYEASGGVTPTGDTAYRNVNGAMDHGYELELSGQLAPGWQAQGSYSVNRSSLASYVNKPKQQFSLGTTYSFNGGPLSGLTVGANARWQSEIRVYHNSTYETKLKQDPYWVFDLMARYRFDRHWSASLNIGNVFDKDYKTALNWRGGGGEYYNWGAPRSVYLNVRYDF